MGRLDSDLQTETESHPLALRIDPVSNLETTRRRIGYVPRRDATRETYTALGFKCGLEVHQQLMTDLKLFCRCPAGRYQAPEDFDAEIIRHMRPTLSELGEYDGTALMEFRTKKQIVYRIKNETACTYDIDDTPPFPINREALDIAIELALIFDMKVVGEFHIARKQYLDGSIPTGFQRTGIVAIEGSFPIREKSIRVIQLSLEEDSCREVSDIGHVRVYRTDRLGMPLIETVTYPDMLTPDEAAEAAQQIRLITRSSGRVRTGIGAAREDVNVSVTGGTRVEIKGVAHIRWIPELVHNEAFRQRALLEIRDILRSRIQKPSAWQLTHVEVDCAKVPAHLRAHLSSAHCRAVAVNLPEFGRLLSFFTQPGRMFADELSDRLKVIACIDKPNMMHSEQLLSGDELACFEAICRGMETKDNDAQLVIWGPSGDIPTALETIDERCRMAMRGVPNETRKACPDGTTMFERVLPGADRMYPDTDSAPIPIDTKQLTARKASERQSVGLAFRQLHEWRVPEDTHAFLIRRNLVSVMTKIVEQLKFKPAFVGSLLGHVLKHAERKPGARRASDEQIFRLYEYIHDSRMDHEILKQALPRLVEQPQLPPDALLRNVAVRKLAWNEIVARVPELRLAFRSRRRSKSPGAELSWLMGQLRGDALGNVPMRKLFEHLETEVSRG